MKILLAALNAKYIHTCLALHSLKAYAYACAGTEISSADVQIEIAEYTINQQESDIVRDILSRRPDLIAFSCYIWNIQEVKKLALLLHIAMPHVPVWAGGPEVTYDAVSFLEENPAFSGVLAGEGELSFFELTKTVLADNERHPDLSKVPGIVYRDAPNRICINPSPTPLDLDTLPFPYPDLNAFSHRIYYYESSRGCPFQCSYCLSSIDRQVRFKSLEKVREELLLFIDANVPLVKFVDRTFNCDRNRTLAIWNFIKEHDNQYTRFHFEVTADLLGEEELFLLSSLRPGLIQLEIGVQSANPATLDAIHRRQDIAKLEKTISLIRKNANVHQHLDLIAGLPFEDLESFGHSFDTVYNMQPDQLQLGFLKLLKGSEMYRRKEQYGLQCLPWPPYEVAATKWLSTEDIIFLKAVEAMVETYYNSGQFQTSLQYLMHFYDRPWMFFSELALWMEKNGALSVSHSRLAKYNLLRLFAKDISGIDPKALDDILLYDLYLRENIKSRPVWAPDPSADKKRIGDFYADKKLLETLLGALAEEPVRKIRHETHLEIFRTDVTKTAETGLPAKGETGILFHYGKRSLLDGSACVIRIPF